MIERLPGPSGSSGSRADWVVHAGGATSSKEDGASGRLGEWLVRLGLVAGSLTLVLFSLEVGLRVRGRDAYRPTGVIGVSPLGDEPNFRDRTASPTELLKRRGVFRILAVGDSVTWGSGIHAEDAYPARLARRLRGLETGREIEVVNWSRTGWNTVGEWRSLEGRLDLLEPDLVILGYSLNDPEPDPIDIEKRSTLERRRPRSMVSYWLDEQSRLFAFVRDRLENTRQRRAANAYYFGLYDEAEPARRQHIEALTAWSAEMNRRGIPMVLTIFPMFETQFDDYPYRELHERTVRLGTELGLPVLDLLPGYAGVDARRLAVEPFTDSHPNEIGHRMAADLIADWLAAEGYLPLAPALESATVAETARSDGAGPGDRL